MQLRPSVSLLLVATRSPSTPEPDHSVLNCQHDLVTHARQTRSRGARLPFRLQDPHLPNGPRQSSDRLKRSELWWRPSTRCRTPARPARWTRRSRTRRAGRSRRPERARSESGPRADLSPGRLGRRFTPDLPVRPGRAGRAVPQAADDARPHLRRWLPAERGRQRTAPARPLSASRRPRDEHRRRRPRRGGDQAAQEWRGSGSSTRRS